MTRPRLPDSPRMHNGIYQGKCKICHGPLKTGPTYCSRKCWGVEQRKRTQQGAWMCGHYWRPGSRNGKCKICVKAEWKRLHPNCTCDKCGKSMFRSPSQLARGKHFCSVKCKVAHYQPLTLIECPKCGKEFPKHSRQTHCSLACLMASRRLPNVYCDHCGKHFYKVQSIIDRNREHGWGLYCSKACNTEGMKNKHVPNTQCHTCGAPLWRYPCFLKEYSKFFCSRKCQSIEKRKVMTIHGRYARSESTAA